MAPHRAAMEDQFLEAAAGCDFVGMQIYSCVGSARTVRWPDPDLMTQAHMEYRPQALGESVRRVNQVLPQMPIMITENGITTRDDEQRIAYTEGSLRGLQAAIRDGADVRGWFSGYNPTFGLIGVDRESFARTPKVSLSWLGNIAQRNALPD